MHDDTAPCPAWFAEWAADYCVALGLGDDFAGVMHRVWWPAFALAGYSQGELRAALPLVFARPPEWPREHLPAVHRAVAEVRARSRPRRSAAAEDPHRCGACEWFGVLVVPHPADVVGGKWVAPHRTGSVFCDRCNPGRRHYESACNLAHEHKIADPPMTLSHYETRVTTDWAQMLIDRDEAVRAATRAESATEALGPSARVMADAIRRLVARNK